MSLLKLLEGGRKYSKRLKEKKMNVLLLTDLEGLSQVTDIEFMDRNGEKYLIARESLTKSINLATAVCADAGVKNIYYLDGHGGGGNVYEEKIDPRAIKVDVPMWETLMREGKLDCVIEIGAHARAGTLGGFLDHTLTSKEWFCNRINGIEMSELSLHALLCGTYGVPIIASIGDEASCTQAKEYIPEIFVGAVKVAKKRNFATDYENADDILCNTVKRALENFRSVPIYKLDLPATLEVTYYRTDMCDAAFEKCGGCAERIDARTLKKTVNKFVTFSDLKF